MIVLILLLTHVFLWQQSAQNEEFPDSATADMQEIEVTPDETGWTTDYSTDVEALQNEESIEVFHKTPYRAANYPPDMQDMLGSKADVSSPDESFHLLREILDHPDFQADVAPQANDADVVQQVVDWFKRTFSGVGLAMGLTAAGIQMVLLVLLVVVAIGLTAMVLRHMLISTGGRNVNLRKTEEIDEDSGSPVDLTRMAERLAGEGRFREALRFQFLAVIRSLDFPASAVNTNSVIIRQVRKGHPGLEPQFRILVLQFEDVWYGTNVCNRLEYANAARAATELRKGFAVDREASS